MTWGAPRGLTPLQLAKALHPAAAPPASRRDEADSSPAPASSTHSERGVLVVLWPEEECRARLRSAGQGWLSSSGGQGRLPISILAVVGDDILLVALATPAFPGAGPEPVVALEMGGVTGERRRWEVRASGPLSTVIPDRPCWSTETDGSAPDDSLSTGGFAVLALTIRSIRGFEIT